MINQSIKALRERKNTKINQPVDENNIENVVSFFIDEIIDKVVITSTFQKFVLKELNEKIPIIN